MVDRTRAPWGDATLVDQVTVAQRSKDRDFASAVQLLESEASGSSASTRAEAWRDGGR